MSQTENRRGHVRKPVIVGFFIAYALLAMYLASQAVAPMGAFLAFASIGCLLMIFIDHMTAIALGVIVVIMAFLLVAITWEKYGWFGNQSNDLILVWLGMLACGGTTIAVYMDGLKNRPHH